MTAQEFKNKLDEFKANLETQYFEELEKEIENNNNLTLQDYAEYNTSFVSSFELSEKIRNLFISKFAKYPIRTVIKHFESKFSKSGERIEESIPLRIYEINLFWDLYTKTYRLMYECVDSRYQNPKNCGYNCFPKTATFWDLEDVDKLSDKGFRIKFWFEKQQK